MNSLNYIFSTINAEQDSSVRRSNKSAFYTLINYLEASQKGISERDIGNFISGDQFASVFRELITNHVIEQNEEGNYCLNQEVRAQVSPALKELTDMVYKSNYSSPPRTRDPTLELLYNCRNEIFSS